MPELTSSQKHHRDLDHRLVEVAKDIKILTALTVSQETQTDFLNAWKNGYPVLPRLPHPQITFHQEDQALQEIIHQCDHHDPVGLYVAQTAESYREAIGLIHTAGTRAFLSHSFRLYGHPSDPFVGQNITILQAADRFLEVIAPFVPQIPDPSDSVHSQPPIDADTVVYTMRNVVSQAFPDHPVEVVSDPALSSKAAAGATRIRIRSGAGFSPHDLPQLINHELFVHTLTALNGRAQPNLPSMGLGSPRTTQTQEGIAVFAELVTRSMDLMRLRRITLRVRAIAMALDGADFLEVFRFFLESGYDPDESAHSTFRIFRGGDPRGSVVFTKDMIYLGGLLSLQTFLAQALKSGNHSPVDFLFSGRLSLQDCDSLAPAYQSGFIAPPLYLPEWAKDFSTLAPQLIFSSPASIITDH